MASVFEKSLMSLRTSSSGAMPLSVVPSALTKSFQYGTALTAIFQIKNERKNVSLFNLVPRIPQRGKGTLHTQDPTAKEGARKKKRNIKSDVQEKTKKTKPSYITCIAAKTKFYKDFF